MTDLRSELQRITTDFVSAVLGAMRAAPLSDLAQQAGHAVPPPAGKPATSRPARGRPTVSPARPQAQAVPQSTGRRHRATADEVKRHKELALATAKQLPAGFSKGDLMKRAGGTVDLGRALRLLVDDGVLTRKGDRRNARYWVK